MADQLCTLAQVKARIRATDANDDVLLGELIDQVSDWIEDTTHRALVPQAGATYYVDTAPGSVIWIRRGIRVVTTLSIAATDQPDDGSGAYIAVAAADIILRPASIDRRIGWPATAILIKSATGTGRLSAALNGAKIVGDFGFAATPPAIQSVAIDAVVAAYTARGRPASSAIGADDTAVFPWATFFSRGSPQRATIERYRAGTGIA